MKKVGMKMATGVAVVMVAGATGALEVAGGANVSAAALPPGYTVTRVVDGDTLEVNVNGKIEKVRIVGVDAPELNAKATTKKGCFATQAKSYLTNRLQGRNVRLLRDTTQANRDKYGRLLRYVYLGVEDVGLTLVSKGYAREYNYGAGYLNHRPYVAAQKSAKALKRGLWSRKVCPMNT